MLGAQDQAWARHFITHLEEATGAHAEIDTAPLETQLWRLEQGEVDLVMGEFRADTPWKSRVTVIEPIGGHWRKPEKPRLSPVTANGENRWIALIEHEVRNLLSEAHP